MPLDPPPLIGAAIENRAGEVGLAFFDGGRASLILTQFIETARSRSNVAAAVAAAAPARVLLLAPLPCPPVPGSLADAVGRAGAVPVAAPRAAFDDGAGAAALARVAAGGTDGGADWGPGGGRAPYLALAAAAALLSYLDTDLHILPAPASLAVTFTLPSSLVAIDAASAAALRLVASPPGSPSLFAALNHTRTDAGAALLRANLLQPLTHAPTLAARHAAVAELATRADVAAAVDGALRALPRDLDRMLGGLALRPARRAGDGAAAVDAEAGALRAALRAVRAAPALAGVLGGCEAGLLRGLAGALASPGLAELADELALTLNDDAALDDTIPLATRSSFAVRADQGGLLAAARAALAAAAAAAADEAARVRGLPGLKGARLQYTSKQGFVLALGKGAAPAAPPAPASSLTLLAPRRATTPTLAALSARASAASADCLALSAAALDAARGRVLERAAALHRLVDAAATADIVASLAAAARAARGPVAVPVLTGAGPLVLSGLRCPLLEAAGVDAVPNDACVGGATPLHIVTGPNSAGKTTLLRAVALAVVVASVGGLPPATAVALPAVDRVCARAGAVAADPARRASAFGVECRELATALAGATARSLVLLDEPGRGTSTTDGAAIAWAAAEALLAARARTLVATHHGVLGGLASVYAGARLWHLDAEVVVGGRGGEEEVWGEEGAGGDDRAASLHTSWRLLAGPCPVRHYGLALAPACGVPPAVATDAAAIAARAEAAAAATAAAAAAALAAAPAPAVAVRRAAVDCAHRAAALARAAAAGAPEGEVAARVAGLAADAAAALAAMED